MPSALEKRLAEAVEAVANTPVGQETKTFLDVEDNDVKNGWLWRVWSFCTKNGRPKVHS